MKPAQSPPQFWRDPALPFLEGRRATGSLSCYAPHTHPTFSIGMVDAGHSEFALADSSQAIAPCDVVLVRAGDVHSCNPHELSAWSYRMFHLDQAWLARELPSLDLRSQVIRSPQAVRLLDQLTTLLDDEEEGGGDKAVAVTACLHALLQVCASAAAPMDAGQPSDTGLHRAYAYLQAHCHERVALGTLAQLAGLDRFQLIRRFRRQYGMTPHALQLDMKINQARQLLQEGSGAADVAYDTGFADQSHFQRAFKARVAATPLQYRRA